MKMEQGPGKKNILHLIGGGEIGGAEELLLTLMKLLDRDRYRPHLICLCQGPFVELAARHGFTASHIPMGHRLDLSTIKPIREYIRQHQIDLVHTHGVRANLVARPAAKKEGIPVVTTLHSVIRYDYDRPYKAHLARWLTRLGNKHTDIFIAISRAIEEELLAMGVPGAKITLIFSGLDRSKFTSSRTPAAIKSELGIEPGDKVYTLVGRMHPVKGHEYFLGAAARVLGQGVKAKFLMVGDGIQRPRIEQQIREMGLKEHVVMPGYYPDIEDIYRITDILCVPSLMEGLGLVVLEAMNFEVPVIATRVGGIPEIIEDGVDGILVEPRDTAALAEAMLALGQEPERARRLALGGREKVGIFTVERMARQVEEVYLSLLSPARRE